MVLCGECWVVLCGECWVVLCKMRILFKRVTRCSSSQSFEGLGGRSCWYC